MTRKSGGGSTSLDWSLSAGAAIVGAVLVFESVRRDRSALDFQAGMDGTVTAVCVALLAALAHGLRFRVAAALIAPILVVQMVAIQSVGFILKPALGLELLIIGALGLIASSLSDDRERRVGPKTAPRESNGSMWAGASVGSSNSR